MIFKPKFYYNTDAAETAGGAETATASVETKIEGEQKAPDTSAVQKIELPQDVLAKLAEYDELKAYKENHNKPAKTEQEIAKENELDKAEFLKYSVDNDLLKLDDYTKYESIKVQSDADLVFPSFFEDFKEENPDIEDATELAEAAKEAFDKTYKLSSENEKLKNKGLAKLAKEANEIRNPFESKVKAAESSYKEEKEIKSKIPSFDKFFSAQIEKNTPDKVSYKVKVDDEEVPVVIELTKDDKEAIAKEFNTPKTFYKFNKSPEEAEKALDKKIQGWIKVNKFDEALAKAVSHGEKAGMKKGSNVGAENLYGLQQGKNNAPATADDEAKQNQKANEAAKRYRSGR